LRSWPAFDDHYRTDAQARRLWIRPTTGAAGIGTYSTYWRAAASRIDPRFTVECMADVWIPSSLRSPGLQLLGETDCSWRPRLQVAPSLNAPPRPDRKSPATSDRSSAFSPFRSAAPGWGRREAYHAAAKQESYRTDGLSKAPATRDAFSAISLAVDLRSCGVKPC
jgi:hypothetical protein